MVEKRKLKKRVSVSEDDMSILLQRYTIMTVLTLLEEVAQVKESKIDWNELVKKTATGITNAREYQMVWRHLAYRKVLVDKLDDAAQPLDDDSDLECELEAFPAVSNEASVEASAYVKVLIASGDLCEATMSNGTTIEAPLTFSIPNGQASGTSAKNPLHDIPAYGTKITIPVLVPMQPIPSVTAAESLDPSGPASANYPPRRRRKPWSEAEDMELIAAVQKYGEGNWVNILKADFKGDRTASQLSQRWSTIRKRHGNMVGNGSQLSEAQLAARHAMSMALGNNSRAACPITTNAGPSSGGGPSNSSHFTAADIASGGPQSKHQQDLVPSKPLILKNPLPKPAINPDPMAKCASMAAGSRIATQSSTANSLQRAAQSQKGVHVMPGGPPAIRPSVPGSFNGLPSNVHFIRTGLVSRPAGPSNSSRPGTQQLQTVRAASPAGQPKPVTVPSRPNASSAVPSAATSSPATMLEVKSKAAVQTAVLSNARSEKLLANTPQIQKDRAFASDNLLTGKGEGQTSVLGDTVKELGGVSKASRIQIQEKLIPSQETPSNKNENTKIELAVKSAGVQGKVVLKDS